MVKTITLDPIGTQTAIKTNDNLLSGLLKNDLTIAQECGGRGMCSTCHIYVKDGMDALSPMNRREKRTLGVITTCKLNSRLACQARVIKEGVVVEIPAGMYLSQIDDIEELIGRRAQDDILHPISSQVLVEKGKLITRSMISLLKDTKGQVSKYLSQTDEVV